MDLVTLRPPTSAALVTSGWGAPRSARNGTHEGLDFRAPVGSPVFAAADGVVVQVKNVDNSLAGMFVAIRHANGVVTRYLHNLKNLVTVGQRVRQGEQIALLGQTGTSGTGFPHVHFDVKLEAEAFEEFRRRFGTPNPGYREPIGFGVGVPAESLMAGAKYTPAVISTSLENGVQFHKPSNGGRLFPMVLLGIGAGFLVKRTQ